MQWRESQHETSYDDLTLVSPDPIQLIDRTQFPDENSSGVWAKNVSVSGYSLIQGATKSGAYVVWTINIETLRVGTVSRPLQGEDPHDGINNSLRRGDTALAGSVITIRKRYSDFVKLRDQLQYAFPRRKNEIPALPPKSMVSKFRDQFLESRRKGLQYFFLCILLNPLFSGSPIVKKFVRS